MSTEYWVHMHAWMSESRRFWLSGRNVRPYKPRWPKRVNE